jgi:hypothetical protein
MPRQRVSGPSQKRQTPYPVPRQTRRMRKASQIQTVPAPMPRNNNLQGAGRPRAAPAAYSVAQGTSEPRMSAQTRDGVRIVHRELVASIVGSSTFNVGTSLALNPGLAASFPWLSTQATGWEQFRFNKLKFCYYSRCATSTPGSIMMVPDYDAADGQPISEQIASAYRDVEEEVPWTPTFSCALNVNAMHPDGRRKFIRQGALASNLDIKTYDVGNMFVCSTDGTAINWGKLWVEYDVSLFVPQLQPGGPTTAVYGGSFVGGGTTTGANPLGTTPTSSPANNGISVNNSSVITLANPGNYLVNAYVTGTSINALTFTGSSLATVTEILQLNNDTIMLQVYQVTTTSVNQTITLTDTTATISTCDVYIATAPASSL